MNGKKALKERTTGAAKASVTNTGQEKKEIYEEMLISVHGIGVLFQNKISVEIQNKWG